MSQTHSITASVVPTTDEGIKEAAKQLQIGRLVAFPTETVYGLGANALNEEAVLSIFTAKGRPLTDPVIVHVPSVQKALEMVELDDHGKHLFTELANTFWPGPLTLIAKACPELPSCVSAGTGFVGVRLPSHPIARELLEEAQVPVAAPSANRFGHVSPTTAAHVIADLGGKDITIIDDNTIDSELQKKGIEKIGIESTVAKLLPETNELVILRRGGVSEQALTEAKIDGLVIRSVDTSTCISKCKAEVKTTTDEYREQSPGQLITHYAPDITTFLVRCAKGQPLADVPADLCEQLKDTVIIDYNGRLKEWKDKAISYSDISPSGSISEGAANIYGALRASEVVQEAKQIFVADVLDVEHEHAFALHDRMFRAASGKIINVKN